MLKSESLLKAAAKIKTFLGIKEIPIVDGKVSFEEAHKKKLEEHLTEATTKQLIEAFEKDIADAKETEDIRASLEELLKETDISSEQLQGIIDSAKEKGENDILTMVKAVHKDLVEFKASQSEILKKLGAEAEDDTPEAIIKREMMKNNLKHSDTHVFGSGREYDATDGRKWNQAAIKGLSASATDYSDAVVIKRLNADADLYFRENPKEIESLHRDNFQLPAFWPKRLKVDDKVANGSIVTAEITQGRKFNWLPKNIQEIEAEEGKIYPVQIDAEWEGAQLQEIEASWLNMLNKEGSQPEKMSFVRFLVGELMKRARVEDRISTLNGIFVQTPKNADKAGRFINRQNGLFYQLWKARDINKKYRAFSMGEITPNNVYDYFHSDDPTNPGFLKRLPQEVLASTNLVVYLHYNVWTWYKAKYKLINGQNMDYKGLPEHFEFHPLIRVETFVDQEVPSFVFATFDNNIEILENIPEEKSSYKFQTLLRKIYLLGDYKLGVRLIHIGREIKPGDPNEFKIQSVWSNDAPIFKEDNYIPVYDNTTGKINFDYRNVQVNEKWATDVTEIEGVKPGQLLKIRGNSSLSGTPKVKNGAKITLLSGDFSLKSDDTLVLFVTPDFKAKEIKRYTNSSGSTSIDVYFEDEDIDVNSGTVFRFNGSTDTTLSSLNGGVENKSIRIYGVDTTDVDFTVQTIAGEIEVGGTAIVLKSSVDYVELILIGGTWYLTDSQIA